jgi:hypothetical protein
MIAVQAQEPNLADAQFSWVTVVMVTIDPHLATSDRFDFAAAMEPVINTAWYCRAFDPDGLHCHRRARLSATIGIAERAPALRLTMSLTI